MIKGGRKMIELTWELLILVIFLAILVGALGVTVLAAGIHNRH